MTSRVTFSSAVFFWLTSFASPCCVCACAPCGLFAPRRQVALCRAGEWEGGHLEGRHVPSGQALCMRRSVRHRGNNAVEQEGAKKAVNTQIPSPRRH